MSLRVIGLIVLLILLVIFAIQNTQPVALNFLFWQASTSAVVSILVSFLVGCLVGWLICFIKPRAKKDAIQM